MAWRVRYRFEGEYESAPRYYKTRVAALGQCTKQRYTDRNRDIEWWTEESLPASNWMSSTLAGLLPIGAPHEARITVTRPKDYYIYTEYLNDNTPLNLDTAQDKFRRTSYAKDIEFRLMTPWVRIESKRG
mgnify:CR=1 FL=1